MYSTNDTLSVTDSTFTDNTANRGGAVSNFTMTFTISSSTFVGNSTIGESGGAILNLSSDGEITDSIFEKNYVAGTASDGGAIENSSSSPEIINSAFVENSATDSGSSGGAIFNYSSSSPTIINCTFTQNSADVGNGTGGAIGNEMSSSPTIVNSIFWNDSAVGGAEIYNIDGTSIPSISYSDVEGGSTANGNISSDPLFDRIPGTNGSSDYGDLRLQTASPALNIGSVGAIPSGITTDITGSPRVVNNTVDLGAYEQQIIYVDAGATGTDDGSSWANAYTSLNQALDNLGSAFTIEMAGGTYTPSNSSDPNDTFELSNTIDLSGGYAGSNNPSSPNDQDISLYPTILSGNIGNGEYSYHVLYIDEDSTVTLNGLTIEDGLADGTDNVGGAITGQDFVLNIVNCAFTNNAATDGGAIYTDDSTVNISDSTFSNNTTTEEGGALQFDQDTIASITNSTFTNNTAGDADSDGGAIFSAYSGTSLTLLDSTFYGNSASFGGAIENYDGSTLFAANCVFVDNTALGTTVDQTYGGWGGAIDNELQASAIITNSTFSENSSQDVVANSQTYPGQGGAINASDSTLTVTNSIIWGDTATNGPEVYADSYSTFVISNSDVQDSAIASEGTDNISSDPLFTRNPGTNGATDYGDLTLSAGSPAINAGNNADVPSGVTTDIAGNTRIQDGTVDMGAYESAAVPAVYVDASATGNNDGSSWANAFTTLTAALASDTSLERIDIAGGTYYPTASSDRTASFNIPDGLAIYGGYAGASIPGYRDVATSQTILSGDINGASSSANYSYHVVTLNNVSSSTILDGVTITDGNANGTGAAGEGGGILMTASSPTINNCTITANSANNGGGVYATSSSSPTFNNSDISSNGMVSSGAAFYIDSGTLTLTDCTIENNFTSATGYGAIVDYPVGNIIATGCTISSNTVGGFNFNSPNTLTLTDDTFSQNSHTSAITAAYGTANLTSCTFTSNSTLYNGGAIDDIEAHLTITGATFTTNSATGNGSEGGAIYFDSDFTSAAASLLDCIFDGNSANLAGGAIAEQRCSTAMTNCLFDLNTAGVDNSVNGIGGAVYSTNASATIINCTFAGNDALDPVSAQSYGGALYLSGSGTNTLSNSILYGDIADSNSEIYSAATLNIDHSDVEGGDTNNGDLASDPLFVQSPGSAGSGQYGDLHLQSGSPAIDAGDSSEVPSGVTTDLDGNPRIDGSSVDMGAYES
jgi:predicted outer membrane repeat protein